MEILLILLVLFLVISVAGAIVHLFFRGLFLLLPQALQEKVMVVGGILTIAFQWSALVGTTLLGGWLGKNWSYLGALGGAVIGFVIGYGIFRTIGEKRNKAEQARPSAANEA